jgi:hypothetical protein
MGQKVLKNLVFLCFLCMATTLASDAIWLIVLGVMVIIHHKADDIVQPF